MARIRIDGITYEHDVVIDCGQVRKRKKKPSKRYRQQFGHTPLSMEEEIPWKCRISRVFDMSASIGDLPPHGKWCSPNAYDQRPQPASQAVTDFE